MAVDGPCKNQTTSCHVEEPEIAAPAAGDGLCEKQATCHVDESKIMSHWIQQGLSGDETERPRPARVLPKTTPVMLSSNSPERCDHAHFQNLSRS